MWIDGNHIKHRDHIAPYLFLSHLVLVFQVCAAIMVTCFSCVLRGQPELHGIIHDTCGGKVVDHHRVGHKLIEYKVRLWAAVWHMWLYAPCHARWWPPRCILDCLFLCVDGSNECWMLDTYDGKVFDQHGVNHNIIDHKVRLWACWWHMWLHALCHVRYDDPWDAS